LERRKWVPELKGTTEEKGEYGRASWTVGGLVLVFLDPFVLGVSFELFERPFRAAYPLDSIVCEIVND